MENENDRIAQYENDIAEKIRLRLLKKIRLRLLRDLLFPQKAFAERLQQEEHQRKALAERLQQEEHQREEAQQKWSNLVQKYTFLLQFSPQCVTVTKQAFAQERLQFLENINKDLHPLFKIPRELKKL